LNVQTIRAGLTYFALVFAAGFLMGAIRVPFLVPRLGPRAAELLEMPVMLIVIVYAARFIVGRYALPATARVRLGAGALALGLLVAAEFLLALGLQGLSATQYVASRDPISGSVYVAMLIVFAVMPFLLARLRYA
jgi:TRAP-type C4-dicarboxylate transport system permease small subunit